MSFSQLLDFVNRRILMEHPPLSLSTSSAFSFTQSRTHFHTLRLSNIYINLHSDGHTGDESGLSILFKDTSTHGLKDSEKSPTFRLVEGPFYHMSHSHL